MSNGVVHVKLPLTKFANGISRGANRRLVFHRESCFKRGDNLVGTLSSIAVISVE